MPYQVTGLRAWNINAEDFEAMVRFYRDVLGADIPLGNPLDLTFAEHGEDVGLKVVPFEEREWLIAGLR